MTGVTSELWTRGQCSSPLIQLPFKCRSYARLVVLVADGMSLIRGICVGELGGPAVAKDPDRDGPGAKQH
ncbi:hypothetical protein NicSoilE8_17490 [Arthrobacter sp. NicSoilE8]|nr:hypothetical protein NicSoilE8_17490 [Arthrobacter sp. NicSoilE8]